MGLQGGTGLGKKEDNCVLGKKPKELKLSEEPESASRPMKLDDDDDELQVAPPVPPKQYEVHAIKGKPVTLEKLSATLNEMHKYLVSNNWGYDTFKNENIRGFSPITGFSLIEQNQFTLKYFKSDRCIEITGTLEVQEGVIKSYNIYVSEISAETMHLEKIVEKS